MTTPEEAEKAFKQGAKAFTLEVGKLCAALSAIGAAAWLVLGGVVDRYIDERINAVTGPMSEASVKLASAVSSLETAISTFQRDMVQFQGNGLVITKGPVEPGGTVEVLYSLRRNLPCPTNVIVQFLSARTGRVDTSLSYTIPATVAPVTKEYIPFPINVVLPARMPDGRWSYVPKLEPTEGCNGVKAMNAPPSEFFEVKAP